MEHTDGANWLHFNYVQQHSILKTKSGNRPFINLIWKAGAGFNIPRTDFTWKGQQTEQSFSYLPVTTSLLKVEPEFINQKIFL